MLDEKFCNQMKNMYFPSKVCNANCTVHEIITKESGVTKHKPNVIVQLNFRSVRKKSHVTKTSCHL